MTATRHDPDPDRRIRDRGAGLRRLQPHRPGPGGPLAACDCDMHCPCEIDVCPVDAWDGTCPGSCGIYGG